MLWLLRHLALPAADAIALANARVVIVSPVVATTPLFSLVISLIFLRGKKSVTSRTILGTVAVVAGTSAMLWEGSGVKSS